MSSLIEVKNLSVEFKTDNGIVEAVRDISFNIQKGKTIGLVGESGSGKSVTALSIMRLIPEPPGFISAGQIFMNTNVHNSNQVNEHTPSDEKKRRYFKAI